MLGVVVGLELSVYEYYLMKGIGITEDNGMVRRSKHHYNLQHREMWVDMRRCTRL